MARKMAGGQGIAPVSVKELIERLSPYEDFVLESWSDVIGRGYDWNFSLLEIDEKARVVRLSAVEA